MTDRKLIKVESEYNIREQRYEIVYLYDDGKARAQYFPLVWFKGSREMELAFKHMLDNLDEM